MLVLLGKPGDQKHRATPSSLLVLTGQTIHSCSYICPMTRGRQSHPLRGGLCQHPILLFWVLCEAFPGDSSFKIKDIYVQAQISLFFAYMVTAKLNLLAKYGQYKRKQEDSRAVHASNPCCLGSSSNRIISWPGQQGKET